MKKKLNYRKKKKSRIHSLSYRISFFTIGIASIFILGFILNLLINQEKITCANTISCKKTPKYEAINNAIGIFNSKTVKAPNIFLSQNENTSPVLGVETSKEEKHIFVNLKTQTLSAYEGDKLFMQTFISSGLWGKTPKGDFKIWTKFRATRMSGGSGADYYDLPNVPYVMFFSNEEVPGSAGFSLHGTYWHNNFGHAMSHGCVNMKTTDAAKIYEWADTPTIITIYGDLPI